MKKLFILSSIALFTVGCSFKHAAVKSPQPLPLPVKLTQTYTNTRDGYSFRYPTGFGVNGFTDIGTDATSTPQDSVVGVKVIGGTELTFYIREAVMNNATLTPQSIMSEISKSGLHMNDFTITDVQVNGLQGYKVVNNNPKDKAVSDTYDVQLKNDKILDITVVKNNAISQAIFNSLSLKN